MNTINVKTGDVVVVLSGKDKGKKGKVLSADPTASAVIVQGVNMASKHKKPRNQQDLGGIIKKETPIRACKVMRVCPKCSHPTRVKHKLLEDGSKVTVCQKCGETI